MQEEWEAWLASADSGREEVGSADDSFFVRRTWTTGRFSACGTPLLKMRLSDSRPVHARFRPGRTAGQKLRLSRTAKQPAWKHECFRKP